MPLQNTDRLLVGRGDDSYYTTIQELTDKISDGFTGDVVVDGKMLTFANGLLISVS